jgi:hypothetical protein
MRLVLIELVKEVAPVVATAVVAAVIRHIEKCKIKKHYRTRIGSLLMDIRDARDKKY